MNSSSISLRLIIVVVAALLAFDVQAHAQTTPAGAPLSHLTEAARILNDTPKVSLPDKADKKLSDVRNHFATMLMIYNETGDWKDRFSDVENDLVDLIGGGTHAVGTAGTAAELPPPTDSAGTDAAPLSSGMVRDIGMKNLDPAVRSELERFRLELELFMASTMIELE